MGIFFLHTPPTTYTQNNMAEEDYRELEHIRSMTADASATMDALAPQLTATSLTGAQLEDELLQSDELLSAPPSPPPPPPPPPASTTAAGKFAEFHTAMTPEEREFLNKILRICIHSRRDMAKRAKHNRGWFNGFQLVTQFLGTLSGSAGLGSLISLDRDEDPTTFWVLLAVSMCSLASGLTTAVTKTFSFDQRAQRFRQWRGAYSDLITKIADFLTTPEATRKDIEVFKNTIVLEFNSVHSEAF